jgi:2-polyprenyl-3-methyl-5-hydroxy-6-metoxy-1,4-benzoquinol methylase
MKNISEAENNSDNCLIVGAGSGLELLLLRDKFRNVDAYDISISDFCKYKFSDLNLFEKKYDSGCEKKYDAIYAIELLEHLENPYEILSDFSQSLKKNGRLIVTTIKNVPQFDHLFNFSDENEFETKVKNLGFNVLHKQVIKHNYYLFRLDANKCFYVMSRNKDID